MTKLGPLPNVAGVFKLRFIGTVYSKPWVNVMHVSYTGVTLDTTTANSIATAIRGYWTTSIAPKVHNSTLLSVVEVTDLSSRSGAQGTDNVGSTGTGGVTAAPNSVAACLTLKIATRYRGGHPRLYLPGVPNAFISSTDQSSWAAGIAAGYQTNGRAFRTAINAMVIGGGTYALCAVSYYQSANGVQSYRTPPVVYPITDVLCHNRIDTMRRRLGKETS